MIISYISDSYGTHFFADLQLKGFDCPKHIFLNLVVLLIFLYEFINEIFCLLNSERFEKSLI